MRIHRSTITGTTILLWLLRCRPVLIKNDICQGIGKRSFMCKLSASSLSLFGVVQRRDRMMIAGQATRLRVNFREEHTAAAAMTAIVRSKATTISRRSHGNGL